jgi:excinuclease ABC subunit C
MHVIEIEGLAQLDAALEALPNCHAVFAIWPRQGEPYLSHTSMLRRRLLRLLRERETPSRLLNLRFTAARVEYWPAGSPFESTLLLFEQSRRLFPDRYLELLKLRMPPYLKIGLSNSFPRCYITTRLTRTAAAYIGPFRSRASAERFESRMLDLFQMRRCQEDLSPSPDHPGCIYGEMAMCLRPCQEVVGPSEYAQEVRRVLEFLRTDGQSMLDDIAHSRDRLSQEMLFEEAARQHKRYEKVQDALKLRDELSRDVDRLSGVAITPSLTPEAVELWFVRDGVWQESLRLGFEVEEGKPVSLDSKLREAFSSVRPKAHSPREREEYLALLARWFYSSWREGEWVGIGRWDEIPYRKLVNAVARVAQPGRRSGEAARP